MSEIQPYLTPNGMVYRYHKGISEEEQLIWINKGLDLIQKYNLHHYRKNKYQDEGVYELINWVGDGLYNSGIFLKFLGKESQGQSLINQSIRIKKPPTQATFKLN